MALNLNKGDEQNSKPSTDTSKVKQNLSKDNPSPVDRSQTSIPKQRESKRIPTLTIIIGVFIIGLGVFWYMNNENDSVNQSDAENLSATSEEAVTPAPLSEDQQVSEPIEAIDNSIDETNKQITKSNGNNVQETASENANNSNASKANRIASTSSSSQLQGTLEEKARQVISGAFGNGADRKKALGDEYASIQAKVNELYNDRLNK
jgi:hypothetical protein